MSTESDQPRRAAGKHQHRATIIDVAELAGVSRQTVSRVLSGGILVAAATRERVASAISELGYRPNYVARALVQRRSRILGVAARDLNSPLSAPFIARLQALSRPLGYHVLVSNFDLEDRGGIGALDTFVSLGVDGVALFPSSMETDVVEAFARSYDGRVVAIGRTKAFEGVHTVSLDEVAAAHLVIDHLRTTGRKRIALIADEWYPGTVHPRIDSLQTVLQTSECTAVGVVGGRMSTIAGGTAAMVELLSVVSPEDIDAVVAFNDNMAIGALVACRRLGLSVPGDIALVGYDNVACGAATDPPITTVPQKPDRYAEIVFERLVAKHGNGVASETGVTLVAPHLEIRGSS